MYFSLSTCCLQMYNDEIIIWKFIFNDYNSRTRMQNHVSENQMWCPIYHDVIWKRSLIKHVLMTTHQICCYSSAQKSLSNDLRRTVIVWGLTDNSRVLCWQKTWPHVVKTYQHRDIEWDTSAWAWPTSSSQDNCTTWIHPFNMGYLIIRILHKNIYYMCFDDQ